MIVLTRPVFRIPSPFTYTKRSAEGNSFALITQMFGENLFINPITGISKYIELGMLGHNGEDYAVPRGTPVYAAHDGTITKAYDASNSSPTKGYGVYLTHDEGWKTVYWHFLDVAVKEGQKVKAGDLVGRSNNSGMSAGDHLHFGLYPANPDYGNGYGGAISPLEYFSKEQITGIINKNMKYVIIGKEQYLLDENLKIALNIGDEVELAELRKWGLKGSPEAIVNIDGYAIYPLVRKSRLRDLFGL